MLEYVVRFRKKVTPEAAVEAVNAAGAREGIVAEMPRALNEEAK
jgi:hypothetical protein